ncbi:MAG: hypothetical protein ABII82_20775 [Verrucomicrobiota bacterium]
MAFSRRNLILPLALLFALVAPLRAQPEASPALTVRLMSWQGDLPGLLLAGTRETLEVDAREFAFSREVAVKRGEVLRVSRRVEGTPSDEPPPVLAELAIPPGMRRLLVVLAPAPAGSAFPLTGRVWDNSLEAHPVNTMRVLNFSTKALAVAVGSSRIQVAAGGEGSVAYPGEALPMVFVQLAAGEDGEWRMARRGLQALVPGSRMLCVVRDGRIPAGSIMPEARAETVDVFFINDRRPAGPVAARAQ